MFRRPLLVSTAIVVALTSCAGDDTNEPEVFFEFEDASPGSVVGLIAVDGPDRTVEWIDRLDGTIRRIDIDDPAAPEMVATIPVGTDGEQRGLLGQTINGGRRFAAWTQPADAAGDFELVVGEVTDGGPGDIVWSGGRAGGGAIGGVLDEYRGQVLLGLGRNTGWDAETEVGGAMLQIDPAGPSDQEGVALSVGYTNPWAFTVTESGDLWFADNAAGPDPDDPSIDDIERIGRGDLIDDRNDARRISEPGRAPTSMVELPMAASASADSSTTSCGPTRSSRPTTRNARRWSARARSCPATSVLQSSTTARSSPSPKATPAKPSTSSAPDPLRSPGFVPRRVPPKV